MNASRTFSAISLFCFFIAGGAPALAAEAEDLPSPLRARIRLANVLYDEGNLTAALAEYRRIQVESGRSPALFNVGKICAALNRPVEAVAELDRLLANPERTPPDRLEEARRLRDDQAGRIGKLQIKTRLPAVIEVDNVVVGETTVKVVADLPSPDSAIAIDAGTGTTYWLKEPIPLGSGPHFVAAMAPGQAPLRQQIEIAAGVPKEVELRLLPAKGELASIKVKTPIPGADVYLDDTMVGKTPLPVNLPVEAGSHTVALKRVGYRTSSLQRDLRQGQTWEVELSLEEDTSDGQAGMLTLEGAVSGVDVVVDGRPRTMTEGTLRLPSGLHDVEISHSEFRPYRAQVDIETGRTRRLTVEMEAKPEVYEKQSSKVSGQRWRAWGTLALGAVVTGGGTWYLLSALKERDDADKRFDEVQAKFRVGGACDNRSGQWNKECDVEKADAESAVSTAKNKVLGGYIATGVGAAVLVTGVILVLTIDDVSRYQKHGQSGSSLAWTGWFAPQAGGVAVMGSF